MKKLALALVLALSLATSAFALDTGIYGTWTVKGTLGSTAISTTFTITNDSHMRTNSGYVYIPTSGNSEAWHGSDESGDYWAKSVVVDGDTVFFCEVNATKADKNIPTSSWYKLEFNSSNSRFTVKGVTSTFSPGTYYLATGTGTK
jgi:hypothetical protein